MGSVTSVHAARILMQGRACGRLSMPLHRIRPCRPAPWPPRLQNLFCIASLDPPSIVCHPLSCASHCWNVRQVLWLARQDFAAPAPSGALPGAATAPAAPPEANREPGPSEASDGNQEVRPHPFAAFNGLPVILAGVSRLQHWCHMRKAAMKHVGPALQRAFMHIPLRDAGSCTPVQNSSASAHEGWGQCSCQWALLARNLPCSAQRQTCLSSRCWAAACSCCAHRQDHVRDWTSKVPLLGVLCGSGGGSEVCSRTCSWALRR